jgi:hypothetical protein
MVFPGLQPLQLLPADYPGFLLAMLPPGAFILLGCLIAWKNWIDARWQSPMTMRENRSGATTMSNGLNMQKAR